MARTGLSRQLGIGSILRLGDNNEHPQSAALRRQRRRAARRPQAAPHPQGPPDRSAALEARSRAARRPLAPARSADRASASDPGQLRPPLRRASRRARGRDEAAHDRGLRGRDLLRAFRRGEGRRDAAAAGHRAGLRLAVLRDGGRGQPAHAICRARSAPTCASCARRAWAPATARRSAPSATCRCSTRRRQGREGRGGAGTHRARAGKHRHRLRRTIAPPAATRCSANCARRQAHARRPDQDRQRRRPARPRRRRLPDRPQVDARARRARPAPDGGQRRRGRARHVQGSLLSRARSAPLPRRHADRRLGGRGGRDLHLHPRRISRTAADAARGDRRSSSARASPSTPSCICAAAPAPTSAAKSRR